MGYNLNREVTYGKKEQEKRRVIEMTGARRTTKTRKRARNRGL